jgi:hypothetical protein
MQVISAGQRVFARTSSDRLIPKRATSAILDGMDFPIVWVCREEEWAAAEQEGREPNAVPWPADAVQLVEQHSEGGHQ